MRVVWPAGQSVQFNRAAEPKSDLNSDPSRGAPQGRSSTGVHACILQGSPDMLAVPGGSRPAYWVSESELNNKHHEIDAAPARSPHGPTGIDVDVLALDRPVSLRSPGCIEDGPPADVTRCVVQRLGNRDEWNHVQSIVRVPAPAPGLADLQAQCRRRCELKIGPDRLEVGVRRESALIEVQSLWKQRIECLESARVRQVSARGHIHAHAGARLPGALPGVARIEASSPGPDGLASECAVLSHHFSLDIPMTRAFSDTRSKRAPPFIALQRAVLRLPLIICQPVK